MDSKETKFSFINKTTLWIAGIIVVLFLAVVLLWYGNAHSMQATPALIAQVYFDGESSSLAKRCNDFLLLEKACEDYR